MNIGDKVDVLDHGYIVLRGVLGDDQYLADIARTSTQSKGKSTNLVTSLIRDKHTSPIEFGVIQVEVKLPMFVFWDWKRHRTFSYSVLSSRYGPLPEDYYTPSIERMNPDGARHQTSDRTKVLPEAVGIKSRWQAAMDQARTAVSTLRSFGLAYELAQRIIPFPNYTVAVASANLWNWMHFLDLRMRSNAQWEIQEYARAMRQILGELFPLAMEAFDEHIFYAKTFSRTEVEQLKQIFHDIEESWFLDNLKPSDTFLKFQEKLDA